MSIPEVAVADGAHAGAALEVRRIATVLHVAGEVDGATASAFRRAIDRCDRDRTLQAFDLTGVTFFSAAGVNCLVRAGWPGRPHEVVIASPAVRRVLELCDLGFLLTAHGWTSAFDGWDPIDGDGHLVVDERLTRSNDE